MKQIKKLLLSAVTFTGALVMFAGVSSNVKAASTTKDASSSSVKASSTSKDASSSVVKAGSSSSDSTSNSTSNDDSSNGYTIKSATQYRLRSINTSNIRFWSQPYAKGVQAQGNTKQLKGQLVKLNRVATKGNNTYFEVYGLGPTYGSKNLGWINAKALSQVTNYQLPFTYSSQLYPTYAPDACEAVSLLMALSVRGLATNVSTKAFIDGVPRSSNPNYGYTADPYRRGSGATIYPVALARYATKWTNAAADITGASKTKLIYEIRHGNPVVFEGARGMSHPNSDHILIMVGYKPGYFEIADPLKWKSSTGKIFWTSTSNFMNYFTTKKRGSRAMVLR